MCRLQNTIYILILWHMGINLCAQTDSAFMDISKNVFDFGTVYQADGKVPIVLSYTNRGKSTLRVSRIIAPGLSVKEVERSGTNYQEFSEIKLELNPFNSEGVFDRKILIFSNAQNSPQEVRVFGKIISGSYASKFAYSIGDLGFRQSQMNFGYIFKGEVVTRYIPVYNLSDDVLVVDILNYPEYLDIHPLFDSLKGNENGMLEVSFNTKLCDNWDFVIDKVIFEVTGKKEEKGWVTFTSNIRENFSLLSSEELESPPVADIPVKVFNFDTIQARKMVQYNYLLINSGKRKLNIRALKPTCGCTAVLSNTNVLQPGDSTYINLEFNTTGYSGLTKQGVSVITDDPINYKQFLWITGFVE